MNLKICVGYKELIILFFLVSGIMYSVFGRTAERISFILFVCAFISLFGKIRIKVKNSNVLDSLYLMFLVTFIIDTIVFRSISSLVYGISMGVCFFTIRFCLYSYFNDRILDRICKMVLLAVYACLIYCVFKYGISYADYRGFWLNPNMFGLFVFELPTILLVLIDNELILNNKIRFTHIVFYFVGLFFIFISNCRTALIAVILCTFSFLFINSNSRKGKKLLLAVFVFAVAIMLVLSISDYNLYSISVFNKFKVLRERGDVFNLRAGIWNYIWENTGIFEGGKVLVEIASHNVFFGLMNAYGKINALLYLLFMLVLLWKSYSFARNNNVKWRSLPLITTVSFFSVCMTENMLMTLPMVLMYLSLPIMIREDGTWKR